ncbi:MAG: hypothetical protein ACOX5R_07960 [bacterium]
MLNALFGLWQFALVWALGLAIIRRMNLPLSPALRAAVAFGLGETVLSYTLFLLGMAGGLRFQVLVPLAVLGSILLAPLFYRESRDLLRRALPWMRHSPFFSLLALSIFIFYILGACVPEREVDSLWYHLATPLHYITHGGYIQLVPFNMPSHYPMNFHLHYVFSLLVGNDTTAKFFVLCHFIPILLTLWATVQRYGKAEWGMFAVVVYLCILHFRLPVMANVERGVYFYVFLSCVLLWQSLETNNRKLFLLAALFCGMSMGVKFNGLLFGYVGQWLLLLIWFFILRREPFVQSFIKWVIHSVICWLMMSPWLIKSYLLTANPFYPMLGEFFNTKAELVRAMLSNDRNHGLNLLKSETPSEFIGQVLTNISWLLYNNDLIFFLGLLAVLVLWFIREKQWQLPLISATIGYGLFTLLWGSDIARLFAATYGNFVLIITLAMMFIAQRIVFGPLLTNFVIISLFLTFVTQRYYYLRSPNIRWFGQIALTEEARRAWLNRRAFIHRGSVRHEGLDAAEHLRSR